MGEQLYLQFLAAQAELEDEEGPSSSDDDDATAAAAAGSGGGFAAVGAEALESALDVLLTVPWDGPVDEARAGRDELAALLGIEVKTRRVAAGSAGGAKAVVVAPRWDENASYQSLLDDAARGGGY
jgi:tubulin-specific chaperone D